MITKSILTGVWVPSLPRPISFLCLLYSRQKKRHWIIFDIFDIQRNKIYSALRERSVWSKFPIKYSGGVRCLGTDTKQKSDLISSCLSLPFFFYMTSHLSSRFASCAGNEVISFSSSFLKTHAVSSKRERNEGWRRMSLCLHRTFWLWRRYFQADREVTEK